MAESEMRPPFRIPTAEDHAVAAEILDDKFSTHDGAWVTYHKEAIVDAETLSSVRTSFAHLASIARLVEPISDGAYTPIDPNFKATHAFRAGMWTGRLLVNRVYNGSLQYEHVHNVIGDLLPHPNIEDQDEYEANGAFLVRHGYSGLETAGDDTHDFINKWGNEIVSDPEVRQQFALGAGVLIAVSHHVYSTAYPALLEEYQVSRLLRFDEIDQYLSNETDSSSN